MDKKQASSRLLELRNECLIEGDELVQISYLCEQDSTVDVGSLILEHIGGIREIGMATVGRFMKYGIIPIALLYEKEGVTRRALENGLEGYAHVHGNIYRPEHGNSVSEGSVNTKKKAA